jgi:hypothetical protein
VATVQTPQRPFPCDVRQWKAVIPDFYAKIKYSSYA